MITLDHTIVPASDKIAAARFFCDIMGLAPGSPAGDFVAVRVNAGLTLDFDDRVGFQPHHYGFLVDEETFEAALRRLRERGAPFGSGPGRGWDGQIDERDGKRVYFCDENGHSYELFTRP